VAGPCGFDLNQTLEAAKALEQLEGWDSLTAVRNSRCFAVDGNHFFNRPGPRLADSLEIITQALYPDHFDFGHGPERWRQIAGIES
jgi:iron complex transport system substrate-binding protein